MSGPAHFYCSHCAYCESALNMGLRLKERERVSVCMCMYVCVCVCERERERERERQQKPVSRYFWRLFEVPIIARFLA